MPKALFPKYTDPKPSKEPLRNFHPWEGDEWDIYCCLILKSQFASIW